LVFLLTDYKNTTPWDYEKKDQAKKEEELQKFVDEMRERDISKMHEAKPKQQNADEFTHKIREEVKEENAHITIMPPPPAATEGIKKSEHPEKKEGVDQFAEKIKQESMNVEADANSVLKPLPTTDIYKGAEKVEEVLTGQHPEKKEGVDKFAEKVKEDAEKMNSQLAEDFQERQGQAIGSEMFELASSQEYERMVEKSDKPIIVDFYSPSCGNCKRLYPVLMDKYKNSSKQWLLAGANVDKMADIAEKLNIKGVPAVMLFHNGKVVDMAVGADSKLDEILNKADVLSKRGQVLEAAGGYE